MQALLFAYGKQYYYALGALGHVVGHIHVFCSFETLIIGPGKCGCYIYKLHTQHGSGYL